MSTVIRLTLVDPTTLNDVAKWARIAEAIGIPLGSAVKAGLDNVSVTTNLNYVPDFEDEPDFEGSEDEGAQP